MNLSNYAKLTNRMSLFVFKCGQLPLVLVFAPVSLNHGMMTGDASFIYLAADQ